MAFNFIIFNFYKLWRSISHQDLVFIKIDKLPWKATVCLLAFLAIGISIQN